MEEEVCGNCKQYISAANFATHSAFCERNIKICEICDEPVRISEEKEHLEEQHVNVSCSLCDIILEKWMMLHHQEQCPKRKVACEFCDADFPFDGFAEHNEFCGSRTEKCLLCKKYVMMKDKTKHSEFHSNEAKTLENGKKEQTQNVINEFICSSSMSEKKVLKSKQDTLSTEAQKDFSKTDHSEDDILLGATALFPDKSEKVSNRYTMCHICQKNIPLIELNAHIPDCAIQYATILSSSGNVEQHEVQDYSDRKHSKMARENWSPKDLMAEASLSSKHFEKSKVNENQSQDSTFQHELAEEDQIVKSCPFCKQVCSEDRISEHIKNCSDNIFECPLCHEKMFNRDKKKHRTSKCRALYQRTFSDEKSCPLCKQVCSADQISEHIKNCSGNIFECPLCHEKMFNRDKEKHRASQCRVQHRRTFSDEKLCPFCKQACSADQILEHIKNCFENIFECPLCHEKMPDRDKEKHRASQCRVLHQRTFPEMYECPLCSATMSEEDKVRHESFFCTALLDITPEALYSIPDQRGSRKSYEDNQQYSFEKCISCGDSIMKGLMQDHLDDCKKRKKEFCTYCNKELKCTLEIHLKFCKEYVNITKAPKNKMDSEYKGAVPKHSGPVFQNKPLIGKCKHCKTTLNADILLYHEAECVHQLIKCSDCDESVTLVEFEKHKCKSTRSKEKRNRNNQRSEKSDSNIPFWKKCLWNRDKPEGKTHDEFENDRNRLLDTNMGSKFIPYDGNKEQLYFSETSVDFAEIPCEFCNEIFQASDIVLHQTGCNPEVSLPKKKSPKSVKMFSQNESSVSDANQFFVDEKKTFLPTAKYERIKKPGFIGKPGEFLSTYSPEKSSILEVQQSKFQSVEKESTHSVVTSVWNIDSLEPEMESTDLIHLSDSAEKMSLDVKESEKTNSDEFKRNSIDSDEEISNMIAFITDNEILGQNDDKAAKVTNLKSKNTSDILAIHHSKSEKHKESSIPLHTCTKYKYLPDFSKSTHEYSDAETKQQFANFRFGSHNVHKVQDEDNFKSLNKDDMKKLSLNQATESPQPIGTKYKYLPDFSKSTHEYDAETKQQFANFRFGSHNVHKVQDEDNFKSLNKDDMKKLSLNQATEVSTSNKKNQNNQSEEIGNQPYKKAYEYILNASGENSVGEITSKLPDSDKVDHTNAIEDIDVNGKKHQLQYDTDSKTVEPVLKTSAFNKRGADVIFQSDALKSKDEISSHERAEGLVHKEELGITFSSRVTSVPEKTKETSKYYTTCHICKGIIKWIDFNTHVASCATEFGKCSRCGEDVPSSELKDHVLIKCPKICKTTEPDLKKENVKSKVNLYEQALKSLSGMPFVNDGAKKLKEKTLKYAKNGVKESCDNAEKMDYTESSESHGATVVKQAFTVEPVQYYRHQSGIYDNIKEKYKSHEMNSTKFTGSHMNSMDEDVEAWKKWRCRRSSDSN